MVETFKKTDFKGSGQRAENPSSNEVSKVKQCTSPESGGVSLFIKGSRGIRKVTKCRTYTFEPVESVYGEFYEFINGKICYGSGHEVGSLVGGFLANTLEDELDQIDQREIIEDILNGDLTEKKIFAEKCNEGRYKNVSDKFIIHSYSSGGNGLLQTQIYACMEVEESGGWISKKSLVAKMSKDYNISKKQATRRINKNINAGYITNVNGKLHVKAVSKIVDPGKGRTVNIVKIRRRDVLGKQSTFKSLLNTIVETHLLRRIKIRQDREDQKKRETGSRSEWRRRDYAISKSFSSGHLSCSYLERTTTVPKSTVYRMRQIAKRYKFAEYKNSFNPLFDEFKLKTEKDLMVFLELRESGEEVDVFTRALEDYPALAKSALNPAHKGIVYDKQQSKYRMIWADLVTTNVKIYKIPRRGIWLQEQLMYIHATSGTCPTRHDAGADNHVSSACPARNEFIPECSGAALYT